MDRAAPVDIRDHAARPPTALDEDADEHDEDDQDQDDAKPRHGTHRKPPIWSDNIVRRSATGATPAGACEAGRAVALGAYHPLTGVRLTRDD